MKVVETCPGTIPEKPKSPRFIDLPTGTVFTYNNIPYMKGDGNRYIDLKSGMVGLPYDTTTLHTWFTAHEIIVKPNAMLVLEGK